MALSKKQLLFGEPQHILAVRLPGVPGRLQYHVGGQPNLPWFSGALPIPFLVPSKQRSGSELPQPGARVLMDRKAFLGDTDRQACLWWVNFSVKRSESLSFAHNMLTNTLLAISFYFAQHPVEAQGVKCSICNCSWSVRASLLNKGVSYGWCHPPWKGVLQGKEPENCLGSNWHHWALNQPQQAPTSRFLMMRQNQRSFYEPTVGHNFSQLKAFVINSAPPG